MMIPQNGDNIKELDNKISFKPIYNIFGSTSSRDYNLAVVVPDDIEISPSLVDYVVPHIELRDKPLSIDLVKVQKGIVVDSLILPPAELNNAIFATYELHQQYYEKFVRQDTEIDPIEKIKNCLMNSLRWAGVKTNEDLTLHECIQLLDGVNFLDTETDYEYIRKIAFQLSTTLIFLEKSIQVYTKESVLHQHADNELYDSLYLGIPTIELEHIKQRLCLKIFQLTGLTDISVSLKIEGTSSQN